MNAKKMVDEIEKILAMDDDRDLDEFRDRNPEVAALADGLRLALESASKEIQERIKKMLCRAV